MPGGQLVHADGERGLASEIHDDPPAVLLASRQVQDFAVRLAAGREDRLVGDQVPPLLSALEDRLQESELGGAGGIQRLFQVGKDAPAIVVAVGVMGSRQVGVICLPANPERGDVEPVFGAGS